MQYITTTQLRTKSKELVKALGHGQSVDLIHRSRIIAKFEPKMSEIKTITDINEFKKDLRAIKPKHLVPPSQRERALREAFKVKHG